MKIIKQRKKWIDKIICQDMKTTGKAWDKAKQAAIKREDWHQRMI